MTSILEIKSLRSSIDGKEVLKGINLDIEKGSVIVIMGPNGSGKSTLANTLMGSPKYESSGEIILDGEDISRLGPDERSRKGIFLSFQHPVEIPGVSVSNFIRAAINSRREKRDQIKLIEFARLLNSNMDMLGIPRQFASRYLNEGFSGGEKKKMEMLQLSMLSPKVAILDETDSGLDIDSLKRVCESVNRLKEKNSDMTVVIITHYQRMLKYITSESIMIMLDGTIVARGGYDLIEQLEKKGYDSFKL